MKRRMRMACLVGLASALALSAPAEAGGRRGGRTYVYNGSRGYYIDGVSTQGPCGCGVPAPHTHAAVASVPVYAAPQPYYAPQPAYVTPQTPTVAVPQR